VRGKAVVVCVAMLCTRCGIYTFSGSTLPGYLKTVDVPLFANRSLQAGVAEDITEALTGEVMRSNMLDHAAAGSGDATIGGVVVGYNNQEYFYEVTGVRTAEISEYIVTITATVEFRDNIKNEILYEGTITGEGVYNFETENEDDGRKRAVEDVIRQIMQNSIQSW
jgi:hypothetical protein